MISIERTDCKIKLRRERLITFASISSCFSFEKEHRLLLPLKTVLTKFRVSVESEVQKRPEESLWRGEMSMFLSGVAILFRGFYSPVLYFPISNSKVYAHNKIPQIHPGSINCKVWRSKHIWTGLGYCQRPSTRAISPKEERAFLLHCHTKREVMIYLNKEDPIVACFTVTVLNFLDQFWSDSQALITNPI